MSIAVPLAELAQVAAEYGHAYLLTTGADGRPRPLAVNPRFDGDVLVVSGCGHNTRANVAERPLVALVWPPDTVDGFSLIVDGEATADGATADGATDDDGQGVVRIAPTWAVKHRPAT